MLNIRFKNKYLDKACDYNKHAFEMNVKVIMHVEWFIINHRQSDMSTNKEMLK